MSLGICATWPKSLSWWRWWPSQTHISTTDNHFKAKKQYILEKKDKSYKQHTNIVKCIIHYVFKVLLVKNPYLPPPHHRPGAMVPSWHGLARQHTRGPCRPSIFSLRLFFFFTQNLFSLSLYVPRHMKCISVICWYGVQLYISKWYYHIAMHWFKKKRLNMKIPIEKSPLCACYEYSGKIIGVCKDISISPAAGLGWGGVVSIVQVWRRRQRR